MLQKKITLIWNVQNGKSIETGYIHISLCIWPYREEFHSSARKFEDELLVGTLKKNKWQGNKKIYMKQLLYSKKDCTRNTIIGFKVAQLWTLFL